MHYSKAHRRQQVTLTTSGVINKERVIGRKLLMSHFKAGQCIPQTMQMCEVPVIDRYGGVDVCLSIISFHLFVLPVLNYVK